MLRRAETFLLGVVVGYLTTRLLDELANTPTLWEGIASAIAERPKTCDYQYPHSGRCGLPAGHGGHGTDRLADEWRRKWERAGE